MSTNGHQFSCIPWKAWKDTPLMATPKLSSRWLPLAPYLGFPHMSFTDTAHHLLCYLRNKFAEAVLRGDITKMEEFTLHNGLQVRDNVCFTYKGWRYRKNAWPFALATVVPRFLSSIRFTIPPFLVIGYACISAALHWAQRTPTANNTGYLALIKSSKDRHCVKVAKWEGLCLFFAYSVCSWQAKLIVFRLHVWWRDLPVPWCF